MSRGPLNDREILPAAINIVDVLRGMGHRKLLVFGLTTSAFVMGLSIVTLLKPIYTTESRVLIANLDSPYDKVQSGEAAAGGVSIDEREVETQMAVIRSDDLGRRVVAALKLQDDPDFNSLLSGMGTLGKLKIRLGFGDDPRLKTPEERALSSYNSDLTVYPVPGSNVVAIKVSANDPEDSARVANTLAETYVSYTREAGQQPTERARQWLAQQIDGLRNKVAASDAAVEQFRAQAGLFQGEISTLGSQELSELNTQITLAEANKTDAQSRADSIRQLLAQKGTVDASADVLNSAVIQTLKQQQTEVLKSIADLSTIYLSNHPKMIAAQKQLDNINRRIRSEALRIVEGLDEAARIAEAREQSLRQSLDRLKGKASTSNLDDVKLKALEREAAANRSLLETMLSRYAEATARLDPSAQAGTARVIQSASPPKSPTFPKKGPMVVLITIAGLCLSLALAFLLEIMAAAARLNQRLSGDGLAEPAMPVALAEKGAAPADPDHAPMAPAWEPPPVLLPPLAVLPAVLNPGTAVAQSGIDALLAWFEQERQIAPAVSLAITSLGGGPGDAAQAAVTLARSYAGRGRRTIVIDACPGNSWFPVIGGAGSGPGLSDLVSGKADFTRVIARDQRSTAHILRFGGDNSIQGRNLIAERLGAVLAALGQSYDTVVIHCGEAVQETPALIRASGATIFLAPATRLADVTAAIAALRAAGYARVAHAVIGQTASPATAVNFPQFAATA